MVQVHQSQLEPVEVLQEVHLYFQQLQVQEVEEVEMLMPLMLVPEDLEVGDLEEVQLVEQHHHQIKELVIHHQQVHLKEIQVVMDLMDILVNQLGEEAVEQVLRELMVLHQQEDQVEQVQQI
jgi:hypothetical protein